MDPVFTLIIFRGCYMIFITFIYIKQLHNKPEYLLFNKPIGKFWLFRIIYGFVIEHNYFAYMFYLLDIFRRH